MPQTIETLSANVLDLERGLVTPAQIYIRDGRIAAIVPRTRRHFDTYLIPGFVDGHVHIESAMLPPSEFARLALPHGTVAAICDPHEIANVEGIAGINYLLDDAKRSPMQFLFGAPACVPATPYETTGATIGPKETAILLDRDEIGFLGEVMDTPAVIEGQRDILAKIHAARSRGKPVDGHAPGLRGPDVTRYFRAGITTDHECTTLSEAHEKIEAGALIGMREGSAARDLDALMPLLKTHPERVFFCTDDCHPDDLVQGHIDLRARRAIAAGYNPIHVLRAASLVPARHYKLDFGLLRVGDRADFLEVRDLRSLEVLRTIIGGDVVAEGGRCLLEHQPAPPLGGLGALPIEDDALILHARTETVRTIDVTDGALFTQEGLARAKVIDNETLSDPERDLLKLVVLNRYRAAPPAIAFVRGFGLQRGALASSVAHDAHNIIAVGVDDRALQRAIDAVIVSGGGLAVADEHRVDVLPLPIAGLLSDEPGPKVAAHYRRLTQKAHALGCPLQAPLMTLSFLSLGAIPSLRLTDRGLLNVNQQAFVDVFV
jgi:adenine deaminase